MARALLCAAGGALAMAAFTLSPQGYVGVSDPPLRLGSPVWLVDAALLAAFLWWATLPRGARLTVGTAMLGLAFGTVNYFATTLFAYDTWSFLHSAVAWAEAAVRILLQSTLMSLALAQLCAVLENRPVPGGAPGRLSRWVTQLVQGPLRGMAAAYRSHPTRTVMLYLVVCWLPYLVVFYPGTVIWDMGEMLAQLQGLRPLTDWHPLLTSWLFGGCVWLGRQLSGDNLGACLFMLLQTAALAYALAEAVRLIRNLGLGRGVQLAALAFFGLTPIFGAFAQAIGKDTLYTAALLVTGLRIVETVRFGLPRGRRLAAFLAWALLASLLRTNGMLVVAGMLVLLAGVTLYRYGKHALRLSAGALAVVLAAVAFNQALIPALGIPSTSASGLYAVPFQQSARTLRDHAGSVTPEEYAAIDLVLDAPNLPTLYDRIVTDPVKYTFKQYALDANTVNAALARYRAAWLSMLRKYPVTYLEAFVACNSGYYAFTPKIDASRTFNNQGGIRFVFETYDLGADPRYLHTEHIPALEGARTLLAAYARGWRRVPVLELFLFCPVYTWLLIGAGLSLGRRRRWGELLAFGGAALSFGVCLLSPVNDYFRYFLPIVAMCPPLLALAAAPPSVPDRSAVSAPPQG